MLTAITLCILAAAGLLNAYTHKLVRERIDFLEKRLSIIEDWKGEFE